MGEFSSSNLDEKTLLTPPDNQRVLETPIFNIKERFETKSKILPNTAKLLLLGLVTSRVYEKNCTEILKKRDFDAPPWACYGT